MLDVLAHDQFAKWRSRLKDQKVKAMIAKRIVRLQSGNMGDVKFFDGIGEIRIHYGPGYRMYFMKQGNRLIVLLCGGDKSSQKRDIEKARNLAKEVKDDFETD